MSKVLSGKLFYNEQVMSYGNSERLSRSTVTIYPDYWDIAELHIRGGFEDNSDIIFPYFSTKNNCCDPSLELSQRDSSTGGSQNTFLWSNMAKKW